MKKSIKIIIIVLIIALIIPTVSCSNNDDVKYSRLGLSYRFQKQDDWIYYAEYNFSDYPGGLWTVSSDGEEKKKIIESDVDLFTLYGNQILYITYSENDEQILHIVGTEGTDEKLVYKFNENSSRIIKMDAASDRCYVLDADKKLHAIELDNGKVSVFDNYITDFCIDSEWVYYLKTKSDSDEMLFQLWRTDVDGTQHQQLMNSFESALDYSDNRIYYINKKDGDIYSIDFFGDKPQKILECEGVFFLKVIGDWIYYGNQDKTPCIYKVKRNGEENQKIDDYGMRMAFSIYFVCILDNWVWYVDMDDKYVSINKMIRINDMYKTDDVIEDILEEMTPSWVLRKYE